MSSSLLLFAAAAYLVSFVGFALGQLAGRSKWETTALWLTRAGFIAHTVAFGMRWAAGAGKSPPVISIYETLLFVPWGLIAAHHYMELRHEARWAGTFATIFAFLMMGIAALLPEAAKDYQPLLPALQSKWIYFHVLVACLAYGFIAAGAFVAVFHLIREKVETEIVQAGIAVLGMGALSAAAGKAFFQSGHFQFFKVIRDLDGGLIPVNFILPNGQTAAQFVSVPWAGVIAAIVLGAFLLQVIISAIALEKARTAIRWLFRLATAGMVALTLILVASNWTLAGFQLFSNPYKFAAVVGLMFLSIWGLALLKWRTPFEESLPEAKALDRLSYRAILLGFVFLTLTLLSGAIWAHYAWGRYWGWDTKEIWTLATWLMGCVYLHVRVMNNWEGKQAAWVAIACFFFVAFTFLGVNLLFPGLHQFATG